MNLGFECATGDSLSTGLKGDCCKWNQDLPVQLFFGRGIRWWSWHPGNDGCGDDNEQRLGRVRKDEDPALCG